MLPGGSLLTRLPDAGKAQGLRVRPPETERGPRSSSRCGEQRNHLVASMPSGYSFVRLVGLSQPRTWHWRTHAPHLRRSRQSSLGCFIPRRAGRCRRGDTRNADKHDRRSHQHKPDNVQLGRELQPDQLLRYRRDQRHRARRDHPKLHLGRPRREHFEVLLGHGQELGGSITLVQLGLCYDTGLRPGNADEHDRGGHQRKPDNVQLGRELQPNQLLRYRRHHRRECERDHSKLHLGRPRSRYQQMLLGHCQERQRSIPLV